MVQVFRLGGFNLSDLSAVMLMPAMIIASIIGGALWAMIPALLKVRFNTNEILVSLHAYLRCCAFIDWWSRSLAGPNVVWISVDKNVQRNGVNPPY